MTAPFIRGESCFGGPYTRDPITLGPKQVPLIFGNSRMGTTWKAIVAHKNNNNGLRSINCELRSINCELRSINYGLLSINSWGTYFKLSYWQ